MAWTVRFALEFAAEFSRLPSALQIELLAQVCGGQRSPLTSGEKRFCWRLETKTGVAKTQFYRQLIAKADRRFSLHLSQCT